MDLYDTGAIYLKPVCMLGPIPSNQNRDLISLSVNTEEADNGAVNGHHDGSCPNRKNSANRESRKILVYGGGYDLLEARKLLEEEKGHTVERKRWGGVEDEGDRDIPQRKLILWQNQCPV